MRALGGIAIVTVLAAALAGSSSARRAVDDVRRLVPVADAFVSEAAVRTDTRRDRVLVISSKPVRTGYRA